MINNAPLVLLILDGWGYREEEAFNAIAKAHTPQWDEWWQQRPHMLLDASGRKVGLPQGQMGNSEVGHMHIGAGRTLPQDFTRINDAIAFGSFFNNQILIQAINHLKQQHKCFHVMGLLSPGGVHSHETHLFAFLKLCHELHFKQVILHLFLDGRDTPPQSAASSLERLNAVLKKYPVATIGSISGRYYAMDRDNRWQRVEPVYRLLTDNKSPYHFPTAKQALAAFYQQNIYDEFIPPTRIGQGKAIDDGDAVFFFNFRADRARELSQALLLHDFSGFERPKLPKIEHFLSMTQFATTLPCDVVFPPVALQNTLGSVIAANGLSQLRIAETEKYAHVTFFLNGGSEQVFADEERILIPSLQVATYDEAPQMSAPILTDTLIEEIDSGAYDIIICNYANADMVGHTGNFAATVSAIEALDKAMSAIWQVLRPKGGQLLITADHGNAEQMFDPSTQQPHTAHTNELVPLLYIGDKDYAFNQSLGCLTDIAPTILSLLGITPPAEMTGKVLLSHQSHG